MNDDKFQRIEDKIDKMSDSLASIDKTLDRNTLSLELHVKRTNILEKRVEHVDNHVVMINGVFKFILGLTAVLGTVAAILKLFF